jgi:formimidoylglutamate deiminase
MQILAAQALLPDGWADGVRVTLEGGRIVAVETGLPGGQGVLLPAPANLHSHTFQRAMAGLTEHRTAGQDSFWTWRRLMYDFLGRLTPGDVQAIAAQAFIEMAEAGFAACAEFHYLHHAPGGNAYADPAEMAHRVATAAEEAGLGLTLLPVLYERGGCDNRALAGGQLRFGCDPERFAALYGAIRLTAPDAVLGVAPHSLRAVSPEGLAFAAGLAPAAPLHLHIAEQQAEVDEVLAATGARPVEWLLANAAVGPRWCAVHATHMTPAETAALAATGAVAGLCPITEANLGDGLFDAPGWRREGGAFGVGSDSNVLISLAEELRLLEYGQRLRDRARAVIADDDRSTGRVLWQAAAEGGAQAACRAAGRIAPGLWADLVRLDHPEVTARRGDAALDSFIFAGRAAVADLWSAGRHIVAQGRHVARDSITPRFLATMARLA